MKNAIKTIQKYNRSVLATTMFCAAALTISACSSAPKTSNPNGYPQGEVAPPVSEKNGYNESELVNAISDHMGVTAESAASTLERLFKKQGRPVGYITGEEGGGALIFGAKYGEGTLWMKNGETQKVYWKGPTVGLDAGAEVSRVFTLVYDLDNTDDIFRRFPGVDGSAYLVAGMAVHYERANGITLAPVRAGAGVRLGANVGYTSYVKKKPKGFGLIPI
ncbi:MAG: EipA family protein [Litorimonas sp.]